MQNRLEKLPATLVRGPSLLPIRVGSWPGPNYHHNYFIQMFCKSLVDSGISVVHVADPRRVSASEIDILHIHWPEKVFWDKGSFPRLLVRWATTLVSIHKLKRAGVRIVWTVHNLRPHDLERKYSLLWTVYAAQLSRLTDGFVTLCPSTVKVVRQEISGLSQKPAIYAWHPVYPHVVPEPCRERGRQQLGIDADVRVFAFLGLLRPYKGVEELIAAFRTTESKQYALLIAGAPASESYSARIKELSAGDSRIHLRLRRLSDEEYAALSAVADVIVLPFRDSLHSGSLVHAVSQRTAALTPAAPFASSLQQEAGEPWIQTYTPPLTGDMLQSTTPAHGVPELSALATNISGPKLAAFYRRLIERNGSALEP
jgi:glycosyltransferase involved in cell wall biosynthesis